ncbi:MAG: histidine--tRNA ligase [SAR202 cluster bacterium]|nr:histidine--tRNA ligase [SAR202 cluster bacterium]
MYQAPRGTADILPEQQPYWNHVCSAVRRIAHRYGYERIDTPVFEDSGVFLRTVGEDTDIVQKETYSFKDRGGDELTLRPEKTAAVCRAYLEHGMRNLPQPVRLYYVAPMFRYDRPQAGRYRQFHQYGAEAIGDADPAVDAEMIQLALDMIRSIGLRRLTLVLNNIGDPADRARYVAALKEHFRPHFAELGHDGQRRFERNALRLLDSKELAGKPFFEAAPKSTDFLGLEAKAHWDRLLGYLDNLGIAYRLDHRLVRGLDYYTRTVFEIFPEVEGAQSAAGGGGRYDGLMEQLGGKPTPAIGFAAGIERAILNLQREGVVQLARPAGPIVVAYNGAAPKARAMLLVSAVRSKGGRAVLAPERSLKSQMRYADSVRAPKVLILGPQELERGIVTMRDMAAAAQVEVPIDEAPDRLAALEGP